MRHTRSQAPRAVLLLIVVLALCALGPGSSARASSATGPSTSAPGTSRASAGTSPGTLILGLTLKDHAGLERYLGRLYRRGSGAYHHFLSPAQFRRRFGASSGEISGVLANLRGLGLGGARVAADHMYITVPAPARAPHISTTLAARLGSRVSAVITPSQTGTLRPAIETPAPGSLTALSAGPMAAASARGGVAGGASACRAAADAYGAYTAPQLASAYDFNGMYANGYHGEGMSAAVVEYGGFHNANVARFDACYGLHTPVSRVFVDGGAGAPANSSEAEVALDIEVINELAPKLAHLYVYEAPNTGYGELDAYNAFVTQDRAPVLSVSWGQCEEGASQAYERLLGTITEEAAAQGQQIFVAAGDSGASECKSEPLPTGDSISADSEGSLPWVTDVGGTDLSKASTAPGATVHREAVWNDGLGAGGGGQSVVWRMPSWQRNYLAATGVRPDGLINDCGAPAGGFCRMEPDISFNADAEEGGADPHFWNVPAGPRPPQFHSLGDIGSPGYSIYCASRDCYAGGSGWQPIGGTSAAAPLAAAAAVLWDEQAHAAGVSLGFLNPSLYSIAASAAAYGRDFYDISGGSNDNHYTTLACITGCPAKLYRAGRGYDMATGLGAVNVANIAGDLMAGAGAITLTPDSERMYGYSNGGPRTTAAVAVSAPAGDAGPLTYTATSNAAWLVLDGKRGTAPASLRWHVDPRGLAPGSYHGQITVWTPTSVATLHVSYVVTPRAKIGLISRTLHFFEHQVRPLGAKHLAVCGAPLWADELEIGGTLPGAQGLSTPGVRPPGSHRVLRFVNRGSAHSVLHYVIDQTHLAWAGNDANPTGNPRAVQRRPGQPLVPSEGTLGSGHGAQIKLASFANENTVGGEPALQQGTYHGWILISDLADPSDHVRVPVTLTLGSGRHTPRIGVSRRALSISAAPGQTRTVGLTLSDPGGGCGYGYTLSTSAGWLSADPARHAGTVHAHRSWRVPLHVRVAAGMARGTYRATVQITSINAANPTIRVPISLRVR